MLSALFQAVARRGLRLLHCACPMAPVVLRSGAACADATGEAAALHLQSTHRADLQHAAAASAAGTDVGTTGGNRGQAKAKAGEEEGGADTGGRKRVDQDAKGAGGEAAAKRRRVVGGGRVEGVEGDVEGRVVAGLVEETKEELGVAGGEQEGAGAGGEGGEEAGPVQLPTLPAETGEWA